MRSTADCEPATCIPADRMLCGLRVRSDIALPELLPWTGDDRPIDLRIRLGDVPERLEGRVASHPLLQVAEDGHCRFALAAVAAYLVSPDGRQVIIAPVPGAAEAEIRTFLFGTVFAILCLRRGWLALHACCVRVDDKAVAFAGESGVGKSTLAANLWTRGHSLLADDVTVVDMNAPGGPIVLPSFPRVKLWRDSLEALGRTVESLEIVRPALDKYQLVVAQGFCAEPLPLAGLVQLERPRKTPSGLRQLAATEGLARLTMVLYRPRMMLRLGIEGRQMKQFLKLLATVGGLRALRRPETPTEWDEVEAMLPALAG